MDNEEIFRKAERKVVAKKKFVYHFIAFAFVLMLLSTILQYENNGNMLPVIIVGLSWGIGLVIHYLNVFGTENLDTFGFNPHWEEDELEAEIERLKRIRALKKELRKEQDLMNEYDELELKEIERKRR